MMTKWKITRNKLNLFLDMALATAFVVESEEHFSGLRQSPHGKYSLEYGKPEYAHNGFWYFNDATRAKR